MKRLSQYAAVGAVATACHYALLLALVEWVGVPAGWAAMAGSVLGAFVAYGGNRRYTFSHTSTRHGQALPRFVAIAAAGALLNALIVGGGSALGLHYLIAQVLATATVMLATFHLNRIWTFSERG